MVWNALTMAAENAGMALEHILLIMVILGGLIFFALDFHRGVILLMVMTGALFMMLYQLNLNYMPTLVVFFSTVVILALSLLFVEKKASAGGIA